ncbi:MAG: mannose-6-phosphate isomerase, class I [Lachnospiraceae bacterium]|nr:mannose-6-phosphate isomerase, class I [Lachnospiraceae bacterium]
MNKPFLLSPAGKDYLWGGDRLKTEYGKDLPLSPLAETWECSTHPDGLSVVRSGPDAGKTLLELLKESPGMLGTHPAATRHALPVLIKFIDAKQDLSVQVHPDDAYAKDHEGGSLGKTEMWYVLDVPQDCRKAEIIFGLRESMTREELLACAGDGSILNHLQRVPVKKGDVFFVRAGTVHAICGGITVAEIQESSNLTYRIYDYDRVGPDGKKRPLHIAQALDVIDLKGTPAPRQPIRLLKYSPGAARELISRCRYFQTERILLNTDGISGGIRHASGSNSFEVYLAISGEGQIACEEESLFSFRKGDCFFVPASSAVFSFLGRAELLRVVC